MRLSEDRIHHLARRMADEMIARGAVDPAVRPQNLASLIAQVIINDLLVEDEIDAETRRRLESYRNLPPPGTGQYEAAFIKEKREVAARRGYPL